MSARLVQRGTIVALVLATVAAALAAHLVPTRSLDSRRSAKVGDARHRVADALRRRAYYLEDVADMVGVHDDAAADEFARYAHVRGRYERSVVGVQWLRRSPSGQLVPPRETGANPMLVAPAGGGRNAALANVVGERPASRAVALAASRKQVAISPPVRLANGHSGFYLAVPVQARRFTGLLSRVESRSAVVGLIDAQALVAQELTGRGTAALRLRDRVTPLASIGSGLHNAVDVIVPAAGRHWTLSVEGGSLSPLDRALPWLILALGLGLAVSVSSVLRTAGRRRDVALVVAQERSNELAVTLRRVERANEELEKARAEAERLSRIDALTEVFNRRHFSEVLAGELARARRGAPPPAVLLLDVDHFKRINDDHGHLSGDAVLRAAADRIASTLRGSDCLARWGGEEFAILAPATDREGAERLAERTRSAIARRPVDVGGVAIALTASVGAAVATDALQTPDALVNAADQALYEAKRAGRDCVRIHEPQARSV